MSELRRRSLQFYLLDFQRPTLKLLLLRLRNFIVRRTRSARNARSSNSATPSPRCSTMALQSLTPACDPTRCTSKKRQCVAFFGFRSSQDKLFESTFLLLLEYQYSCTVPYSSRSKLVVHVLSTVLLLLRTRVPIQLYGPVL